MGGGSGDRAAARCRSVEVLVASVFLGGLALRARVVASRAAGPAAFEEAATTGGDDDATLAFVVRTRGYDAVSPDVAALYGTWSHVVEPLREATFEAVNAAPTSSLSWRVATLARRDDTTTAVGGFSARTWAPFDASHEWDEVRESVLEYAGDAASLTCAAVHDRYRVTLVEVLAASKQGSSKTTEAVENVEPWMNVDAEDGRGATRSSRRRRVVSSDAVVCKYVRRELRQLSGDDREAYFAALEQVHRTSSVDGKRAYGAKFRSQKTFLLKHLGEDTVKGCSVFHGADAFLTGHAAFTLELEQALQAVDASVSAPYWDTSLDDDARGAAWAEGLELFAEDWFGARAGAGGPKLDYPALTTGRFAYVDVPSYAAGDAAGAAAAPPERNAFGRLTQSYNNDPATFLWRSDSVCGLPSKLRLPGCAALKGALREASVSDLRAKIETDWHGALHPTLGGAFDCASESAGASHFAALAKTAPELVQFVHQLAEAPRRAEIDRRFGTSRPNCEMLELGHIEVDSADIWTDRVLSSSSRSAAEEFGAICSMTLTSKSGRRFHVHAGALGRRAQHGPPQVPVVLRRGRGVRRLPLRLPGAGRRVRRGQRDARVRVPRLDRSAEPLRGQPARRRLRADRR